MDKIGIEYLLTVLLAMISYYLRNMASDIRKLVKTVSRHEAKLEDMDDIYCKKSDCAYLNRERDNVV